jgi:hypothetical protein
MTRRPPGLALALLRWIAASDPLVGDLDEQFRTGRSRYWYWLQVIAITRTKCAHSYVCAALFVLASAVIGTGSMVGWWGTRFAVPVLLGMAITSWNVWRLHRTSLVILYITSVALVSPYWMAAETEKMTGANQLFWTIARLLGGYGVVGVMLVPFLIIRLGRLGPLAEPPVEISLTRDA